MKKIGLALILILLTFTFAQAQTLLGTFSLGSKVTTVETPIGYQVEVIWRGTVDNNRAIIEIITPENNPYTKPGYNVIYRKDYRQRYVVDVGVYTLEFVPAVDNGVTVWAD